MTPSRGFWLSRRHGCSPFPTQKRFPFRGPPEAGTFWRRSVERSGSPRGPAPRRWNFPGRRPSRGIRRQPCFPEGRRPFSSCVSAGTRPTVSCRGADCSFHWAADRFERLSARWRRRPSRCPPVRDGTGQRRGRSPRAQSGGGRHGVDAAGLCLFGRTGGRRRAVGAVAGIPDPYLPKMRGRYAGEIPQPPAGGTRQAAPAPGGTDGNYFARVFRQFTGMSPGEYVRANRGEAVPPEDLPGALYVL